MDGTDRAILTHLQAEGRLPNNALADRVHLSPSPCLRRLRRLEADGTIRGYRAILDRLKVGLGLTVFVELKLRINSQQQAAQLERKVTEIDQILACHMLAGDADFLLEIAVPDLAAYEQLLFQALVDLADFSDVRSNIVIRTTKEHAPLPLPPARSSA